MNKKTLDQTNAQYEGDHWNRLNALAKGGKSFHAQIGHFLPQQPMEPELRYELRKRRAKYYSYIGAIVNLYVSWLFAAGYEAKAYKKNTETPIPNVDSYYGAFQENVGGQKTLKTFMKDRFRESMTVGKSIWIAELPQAPTDTVITDKAVHEALQLGHATLMCRDATSLLDWEEDDDGNLLWCILKDVWKPRKSASSSRNTTVEQWRVYDDTTVTTYELEYKDQEPPNPDTPIAGTTTTHGFKRVPVIRLCLPEELCIGEQTHDAQISHFQHDAALSWSMAMSCYATPVFHLDDEDKKPVLGIGYALFLGKEETLTWVAPPTEAYDAIARNRDSKRDEIFRIVHQMAQGLDNNAETVGRSADSKEIDAAATRILLNAYGEIVAKSIEETYELISEARDETDYEWSIEGFSGYDTATAGSLLANVRSAKTLGLPSNTLHRELSKKAALVLVPELDPRVKETIRQEIDKYDFNPPGQVIEEQLLTSELASKEQIATEKVDTTLQVAKIGAAAKEKDTSTMAKRPSGQPS